MKTVYREDYRLYVEANFQMVPLERQYCVSVLWDANTDYITQCFREPRWLVHELRRLGATGKLHDVSTIFDLDVHVPQRLGVITDVGVE